MAKIRVFYGFQTSVSICVLIRERKKLAPSLRSLSKALFSELSIEPSMKSRARKCGRTFLALFMTFSKFRRTRRTFKNRPKLTKTYVIFDKMVVIRRKSVIFGRTNWSGSSPSFKNQKFGIHKNINSKFSTPKFLDPKFGLNLKIFQIYRTVIFMAKKNYISQSLKNLQRKLT